MSITYRKLLAYFFRGLLFLTPVAITGYIVYELFLFLDNLIPVPIPGIGILMVLALITFVGYLASLFFAKPLFDWFERGVFKIPFVNLLYTSIKDLMGGVCWREEEIQFSSSSGSFCQFASAGLCNPRGDVFHRSTRIGGCLFPSQLQCIRKCISRKKRESNPTTGS